MQFDRSTGKRKHGGVYGGGWMRDIGWQEAALSVLGARGMVSREGRSCEEPVGGWVHGSDGNVEGPR